MPEFSSNVIQSTNPGYTFVDADLDGLADEPLTVDFGVLVYSDQNSAVVSDFANSTLTNHGYLFSGTSYAVEFDGGHDVIRNAPEATILGSGGIYVDGSGGELITNEGTIIAKVGDGIVFGPDSDGVSLLNAGYIDAASVAVNVSSNVDQAIITNAGRIVGYIYVRTGDPHLVTTITNQAGGSMTGTIGIGVNGVGQIHLDNAGIISAIYCEGLSLGHNFIRNTGAIAGNVVLDGGPDVFNGTGGRSGPVYGGGGDDRLIGGSSGDRLEGGPGNDTLTGGPGKDHFVFAGALDAATNVDRITDFHHGFDTIDLSHTFFTKVNASGTLLLAMFREAAHAQDANDRVIYNPTNGWLIYDSNGSGPGGATHFATLASHLTLTNMDFLVVA